MTVSEALENYKNTQDTYSLYENLYFTKLKLKEIRFVLQDTLREKFSEEDYVQWLNLKTADIEFKKHRAEVLDDGVDMHILMKETIKENCNPEEYLQLEESDKKHLKEARGSGTYPDFATWKEQFDKEIESLKHYGNAYESYIYKINHLHKGQVFYGLSRNTYSPVCKTRPYIVYCDNPYTEDGKYVYAMPLIGNHQGELSEDTTNRDNKDNETWYLPLPTPFEVGQKRMGDSIIGNYNWITSSFYGDISTFYHEKVEGYPKFRLAKEYISRVLDTTVFSTVQTLIDDRIKEIEAKGLEVKGLMQKLLQKYSNNEVQELSFILNDFHSADSFGLYGLREKYFLTDEGLLNILKLNFTGTSEEFKAISSKYTEIISSPEAQKSKKKKFSLEKHSAYIWQVSDDQNTRRGFPQKVLVKPIVKKKVVLKKNGSST